MNSISEFARQQLDKGQWQLPGIARLVRSTVYLYLTWAFVQHVIEQGAEVDPLFATIYVLMTEWYFKDRP